MKRTPLKRRTGLKRSGWLPRVNRERRARRHAEAFGPHADMVRGLACVVPSCTTGPPSEAAHVRSRGAGGKAAGNLVPLCNAHHREQHIRGIRTFERAHGLDLAEVARALGG